MKLYAKVIGGGIFSKFFSGLWSSFKSSVDYYYSISNIYFDVDWERVWNPLDSDGGFLELTNPFNFVFDQKLDRDVLSIRCSNFRVPAKFFYCDLFKPLKKVVSTLVIKPDILNAANPAVGLDCIGVHVRLTDMNRIHGHLYGRVTIDDYKRKIEAVQNRHGLSKIFVASDNAESLKELQKSFDVISNTVSNRAEIDNPGKEFTLFLRNRIVDRQFWLDTWGDMLTLSRCRYLIHRRSSFAHAAMLFSNSIGRTYLV